MGSIDVSTIKTAVFGGGCFWCTEAVFEMLRGVVSVTPGYAGGTIDNPTYEQVCTGDTGHAEVIRIEFDPSKISYRDLLTVFFATHDSTTLNRQGGDVGTQYRSVILYTDEAQKKDAEKQIKEIDNEKGSGHVVTEVVPLRGFFSAEAYHKDYYKRNPEAAYCQIIINPKLEKVQKTFEKLLAS